MVVLPIPRWCGYSKKEGSDPETERNSNAGSTNINQTTSAEENEN